VLGEGRGRRRRIGRGGWRGSWLFDGSSGLGPVATTDPHQPVSPVCRVTMPILARPLPQVKAPRLFHVKQWLVQGSVPRRGQPIDSRSTRRSGRRMFAKILYPAETHVGPDTASPEGRPIHNGKTSVAQGQMPQRCTGERASPAGSRPDEQPGRSIKIVTPSPQNISALSYFPRPCST
jgi:hypothetical protein